MSLKEKYDSLVEKDKEHIMYELYKALIMRGIGQLREVTINHRLENICEIFYHNGYEIEQNC